MVVEEHEEVPYEYDIQLFHERHTSQTYSATLHRSIIPFEIIPCSSTKNWKIKLCQESNKIEMELALDMGKEKLSEVTCDLYPLVLSRLKMNNK